MDETFTAPDFTWVLGGIFAIFTIASSALLANFNARLKLLGALGS
jgi:hypothetical protein